MGKRDRITEALKAAKARLQAIQDAHAALQQDAVALNQRGVELERTMLGIQGEITALEALTDGGE